MAIGSLKTFALLIEICYIFLYQTNYYSQYSCRGNMQTQPLTPEQREVLMLQINRRMAKWPDEALEQLEYLTRSPKTMAMQPVNNTYPNPQPRLPQTMAARGTQEGTENKVSRREVLAYGLGCVVSLCTATTAAATGTGWLLTANKLGDMQSASNKTYSLKNRFNTIVAAYQNKIPATYSRFITLQDITSRIKELQAAMSDAFSAESFNLANAAGWLLGVGIEVLKTLPEYINNVAQLIQASQELITELQGWFSAENHIDNNLFQPIRAELFQSIDNLYDQANDQVLQ